MLTFLPLDFIASDPNVRGGRASVAGSSVTVSDVAAASSEGKLPDELADAFGLTLAEIHAALAYYHAHREQIDAEIRADRDQADLLRDMQARRAWINSLKPQIAVFCAKWKITELALFGSVLREDFRADSDIDVLVTFAPDAQWGWKIFSAENELAGILGRKVDLITREGVEGTPNRRLRDEILQIAEVLHAA